jgi:hypothetical protein
MKTNVKVTQMISDKTGEAVKNQFIIITNEGAYFQSYKSVIAFKPNKGKVQLDKTYWDYSRTTGKYRNQFLCETKKETESKIQSGEYILTNLN